MATQLTAEQRKNTLALFENAITKQADVLEALQIPPALFNRVCLNAVIRNPDLAKCNRGSLIEAVYKSCEMGLLPDGKHGVIVPMKIKGTFSAQFWPMIDGLLAKVRENIPNIALQAHNVFDGDEFLDERGSSPVLKHVPLATARHAEDTLLCSYATAHMPGNTIPEVVVMYKSEMEVFRKKVGPWQSHPLEMYRLRPLKRLIKRLPVHGALAVHLNTYDDDDSYEQYDSQDDDVVIEQQATPEPKPKASKPRAGGAGAGVVAPDNVEAQPAPEPPAPDEDDLTAAVETQEDPSLQDDPF